MFIELKLKSIFSHFVFQIRIESPYLSRDDAEIKINQTLHEVERHIEKIKKYNFKWAELFFTVVVVALVATKPIVIMRRVSLFLVIQVIMA